MSTGFGRPALSADHKFSRFIECIPVPHAFSTMRAGNMSLNWAKSPAEEQEVMENLGRLFVFMNLYNKKRVHMKPSHSPDVVFVSEINMAEVIAADALIAFSPDVFLTMCPADCLPIIITSKKAGFVALVHGSKKCLQEHRLLQKVALSLEMCYEQDPNDILVAMGPGIRTCHYNADLFRSAEEQLTCHAVNIPLANIFHAEGCTYCSKFPDTEDPMYFSHRRAEVTGEKEGRLIAFVTRP